MTAGRTAPWPLAAALLAVVLPTPARGAPAPLIVTQRPAGGSGGRIVLLAPDGTVRPLTPEFTDAAEFDVSFDGRRVLFAARQAAGDPWCLYERTFDDDKTRAVTCATSGARRPRYLPPLYTLTPTATESSDPIAFVATVPGVASDVGAGALTSLYSCKLDGTAVRRLTFNLSGDLDPAVLDDGRLVYSAWQRGPRAQGPRLALWALNLDGTDALVFADAEGQPIKRGAAPTARGSVVFVESNARAGDGSGSLASVELRRNLHSYRRLSVEADGDFRAPRRDSDGSVLVAGRPAGGGIWDIYRFDPKTRRKTRLFHDPRWNSLEAAPLSPRPRPDGRSSIVKDDDPLGKLYGLDVGVSDLPVAMWMPGLAHRLRVLEGVPAAASSVRRLLGELDLDDDGSFHLQVPADTPLELQLLDADGLALRRSSWIWTRRHENRGCIGCHEDRERTPPNRFVRALQHPATVLNPPPPERRTVDFRHDVAPIVATRCRPCHASASPPDLDGTASDVEPSHDYRALLESSVDPGQARTSRLIAHVLGRDTARPWDAALGEVPAIPKPGALTPAEIRTLVEWIDWGATWDSRAGGAR